MNSKEVNKGGFTRIPISCNTTYQHTVTTIVITYTQRSPVVTGCTYTMSVRKERVRHGRRRFMMTYNGLRDITTVYFTCEKAVGMPGYSTSSPTWSIDCNVHTE